MAWMSVAFKTTPDGKLVYFPWASFGPGYEVLSEEQEEAIRRYNRISLLFGVPVVIATAFAWKAELDFVWRILGLVLLAASLGHYAWQVAQWAKSMPRSDQQLTHREVRETKLASIGSGRLWFGLALTLLMSIAALAIGVASRDIVTGLVLAAIFVPFTGLFWWLLSVQRRVKGQAPPHPDVIIE